jgi:hypothetical protein
MGFFPYDCDKCADNIQSYDDCTDNVILSIKDNNGNITYYNAEYDGYGRFKVKTSDGSTIMFNDPTNEDECGGEIVGLYTGIVSVYCNGVNNCGKKKYCFKGKKNIVKDTIDKSKYNILCDDNDDNDDTSTTEVVNNNNNITEESLKKLKVVELKNMCKTSGLKKYSKLKKNELISLIMASL